MRMKECEWRILDGDVLREANDSGQHMVKEEKIYLVHMGKRKSERQGISGLCVD